jgi:PAS domain S-box-containing protein
VGIGNNPKMDERTISLSAAGTSANEQIAFLHSIIEGSTEFAIIALSGDGTILSWNEGARRVYGYDPGEIIGQSSFRLLPSEALAPAHHPFAGLAQIQRSGKWPGELTQIRKKGRVFSATVSITSRAIPGQTLPGFTMISREVNTSQQVRGRPTQRSHAFGDATALLNAVLESPVENSIIVMDITGTILAWNEGARRNYGYLAEEMIGRPNTNLLHTAEDVESGRVAEFFEAALRTGKAEGIFERVRKDTGRFTASVALTLRRNADHTPIGYVLLSRDVTDRKRAEERFRALLEAAPDAMVIMDSEGRIKLVNAQTEKLFGYARAELLENAIEMLVPLRFRERHPQHRKGYFMKPKVRGMGLGLELYGLRKDRTEFPVEISLSPIETETGTLVSGAIRDITDQKRVQERLRRKNIELEQQNQRVQQANRLKNEFLANMSHELRTPLNSIIGFSEILHDGKVGAINLKQKAYIGNVLTSARHLLQLINDVLDLSKVESGKMEFFPEPTDPNQLIREVCEILRTLVARKRLRFQIEVDPALVQIVLDPSKLKQILFNYLSNAIKFTPEEGQVTVVMRPDGADFLLLEVKDTGIGIKAEDVKRLFLEFQQLDGSASKKYQGTGLGLALTKRIAEAQGGTV